MKNLVAIGIVGVAAAGAFYIYQGGDSSSEQNPAILEAPVKVQSEADIKAQLTAPRETRVVQANEAQLAMDKMGLWVSEGNVDWAERSGSNGNYSFTDLNFEIDGESYAASNFEISGVRMAENEQPYFDAIQMSDVTLFADDVDKTGSVSSVIINMPDEVEMQPAFAAMDTEEVSSPLDYLEIAMTQEFDTAVPFPEIMIENFKTVETDEIYERNHDRFTATSSTDDLVVSKTVENTMDIGFIGVTKSAGTDSFTLQANNFRSQDHNYRGQQNTTSFSSANLTGFKASVNPEKMAMSAWSQLFMPAAASADMEPAFQSMSLLGFEHTQPYDQFRIDNASVFYSGTQGDRYSLTIDIPRVDVIAKPLPQDAARWASDNPLRELGYESAAFSMNQRTSFDRSNGTIELENGQLSMVDGFEVSGSYRLENWDGYLSRMGFGKALDETPGLQDEGPGVAGANMVFTDRGILDRAFAQQAEEQNMSVEEAKEFAKNGMIAGTVMGGSEYQQELMVSAVEAVSALIDNGGTFTFSMQPPRTVRMKEFEEAMSETRQNQANVIYGGEENSVDKALAFQKFDDLLRLMNITFSHTP